MELLKFYTIALCLFIGLAGCHSTSQIAVTDPSFCLSQTHFRNSAQALKTNGYSVESFLNPDCAHSGTPQQDTEAKVKRLQEAIASQPQILWAAMGGHGADAVVSKLSTLNVLPVPLLLGMSDTTRLQLFFQTRDPEHFRGIQTMAFRAVGAWGFNSELNAFIKAYLNNKHHSTCYPITATYPLLHPISARTIGGLLNGVYYSRTLPNMSFSRQILFLELHDEAREYMLQALMDEGLLDNVSAIVIGDVTRANIAPFIKKCKARHIPVFTGLPFGHISAAQGNFVPINFPARIFTTYDKSTICFDTLDNH